MMNAVSPGFSGKGLVVIITIIFSSLSFTLGYAVGRYGAPARQELPAQNPEPAAVTQAPQQPAPAVPSATPDASVPLKEGPSADTHNSEQAQPAAPPASGPSGPAGSPPRQQATQVKETAKTPLEEKELQPKPDKDEQLFTVQIGAFRNKAEAERLRAKYSKKGYKLDIEAVKSDGNTKVYKVRTGEFAGRKDAELLAVKLKKNEGLNAFVAPVRE